MIKLSMDLIQNKNKERGQTNEQRKKSYARDRAHAPRRDDDVYGFLRR